MLPESLRSRAVNEGQFTALPLKASVISKSPNSRLPCVKFCIIQNHCEVCCLSSDPSPACCASVCQDRVEPGGEKAPDKHGPILAGVFLAALAQGCNFSLLLNLCITTGLRPKHRNLFQPPARWCPGGFQPSPLLRWPCCSSSTSPHPLPATSEKLAWFQPTCKGWLEIPRKTGSGSHIWLGRERRMWGAPGWIRQPEGQRGRSRTQAPRSPALAQHTA